MTIRKLILLIVGMACLGSLKSQDLHYSLFNMAPTKINPAQTGAFLGSVRVGGIFRDQWFTVFDNGNEFRTPSFFIDAPIIQGLRDQDWVGVGVTFINDRVGTGELTTSGLLISGSYHYALDKKQNQMLTFGIQAGSISRSINTMTQDGELTAGSVLQSQLDGTPTLDDPLLTSSGNQMGGNREEADLTTSYFDINFGVLYKVKDPKAGTSLELGLAAAHIGSPNDEFGSSGQGGGQNPNQDGNDDAVRPMTITAHGQYIYPLTDKITAEPSFLFQTASGSGNNIILQAVGGYQLNEQIKLQGGLGYRFGDAGQILAGAAIDERLRLGLSYDLNFSQLSSVTSNQGGFEIAANYIFNIYKQPEIKPTILCPQF